jgi:acetoin utilization protein AcuB
MPFSDDPLSPPPYCRRETVGLSSSAGEIDYGDFDLAVGGLLAVVELERGERLAASSDSTPADEPRTLSLFAPEENDDGSMGAVVPAADRVAHGPALLDVMTPRPTCIAAESTILQLVRLVHAKKFRHLLVADEDGRLVGVVSDRDIVRCFGPGDFPEDAVLQQMTAANVMSTDVVTASPDESPAACIDKMLAHGINCLPVVVDGRPIGILTTADLLRLLRKMLGS